ncbi:FkbM family methyltransferase [Altererythrobacter sp. GH1-8]|uniref:FkbM family methyltransferase n=1 Tax=Altererythrobacter sp. GH1-8 TaxID=3349333 RepID=UPI00374C9951
MKRAISNTVTAVLRHLPSGVQAILLRKAIAIANDRVKFLNGQVTMFGSIQNLCEAGFAPGTIIDVGANVGEWARSIGDIFPHASIHMIEAQPELSSALAVSAKHIGDRASYEIALLGAQTSAEVSFYRIGTGSSVMEEVTNLDKEIVKLPMKRLDEIDLKIAKSGPTFLKLDVQGYELEVLKGAETILAGAEAVLMEISLLPYNRGAPLMPEIIAFMDNRGFVPYDICGQQRRVSDRALFQIDMIFVQKDSALRRHRRFSMFEPEDM